MKRAGAMLDSVDSDDDDPAIPIVSLKLNSGLPELWYLMGGPNFENLHFIIVYGGMKLGRVLFSIPDDGKSFVTVRAERDGVWFIDGPDSTAALQFGFPKRMRKDSVIDIDLCSAITSVDGLCIATETNKVVDTHVVRMSMKKSAFLVGPRSVIHGMENDDPTVHFIDLPTLEESMAAFRS